MKKNTTRWLAPAVLGAGLAFAAMTANAAPLTFFGEDPGLGEGTRLPAYPNATNARNAFFSNLTGVGTHTFEADPVGPFTNLGISFPGAGTATIAAGTISSVPTGTNGVGRYPISGAQYLETSSSLSIAFDQAVAAFGFFGVDIGDFDGQVTLSFRDALNNELDFVNIGNSTNIRGGSVLYFGYINAANPFRSVVFGNTNAGTDFFAFDDFSIGSVEQVTPTPEPGTLSLLAFALLGVGFATRRRN